MKLKMSSDFVELRESLPSRGARVEIASCGKYFERGGVAPLAGSEG